MRWAAVVLLAAAATAVPHARAALAASPLQRLFRERLDHDGDGRVTAGEMQATLRAIDDKISDPAHALSTIALHDLDREYVMARAGEDERKKKKKEKEEEEEEEEEEKEKRTEELFKGQKGKRKG